MGITSDKVFETLTNEGAALLRRHGEDAAIAERGGKEFAISVFNHFGGQLVYFPKFTLNETRKRVSLISKDAQANRKSAAELGRKYKISMTAAYRIIKQTADLPVNSQEAHYVTTGIAIEAARMLMSHGVMPSDAVMAARGFAGVLIAPWGGQQLCFPTLKTIKARQRHDDIVRQYQAGISCTEIAATYGLASSRVYETVRKYCRENGIELPRQKQLTSSLAVLKKRILDIANTHRGKNPETFDLLKSAADTVGQAQKVVAGQPAENTKNKLQPIEERVNGKEA